MPRYYKKKRAGRKGRMSRNKKGGKKRIEIFNMGLKRQLREESACHTGMILRSHEKKSDAWKYTGLVKGQL